MARRSSRQIPAQRVPVPAQPEAATTPSWLRPVVLGLAALALLGWFSVQSADSDTWWFLKSGQYIAQHHSLPFPDPFSYTTYMGNPPSPAESNMRDYNLRSEWLAELLAYLVWAVSGFPGVILIRAAILSFFASAPALVVFERTRSVYRALAAACLAAFCAGVFTSDRPYLFTYLFLAATLLILEQGRRLWLLPPIFLVWSNCHGGYMLGIAALGAYLGEALLRRLLGKAVPGERRLWLVSAACFLASGTNPNGFLGLTILASYGRSGTVATQFEWQHPPFWPPTFIGLLLAASLGLLIWKRSRTRAAEWLLLAAFAAAYFSAVRNTQVAGMIAAWIIFSYMPWKWKPPVAAEWLTAGAIAAALLAEVAVGRAFQLHENVSIYPSGAADFLLAHHINGRMFNSWEKGGYLIWRLWPEQRVFIDGRTLNESVFRDYQRIIRDAPAADGASGRELLNHYGVEVILLNGFEATGGSIYALPLALQAPAEKEWSLVYQDAQASIFMRHLPADVPPLPQPDPLANLEAQCRLILANNPSRPRCARSLGLLFGRLGDAGRARKWMGAYLAHRPDHNPTDDELFRRLGGATVP